MSPFMLKLRIFFQPKIFGTVIVAGFLCWWAVDGVVEDIARSIRFSQGMESLESVFQELTLRRGSRAVWLWTFLPASIGWRMAAKAVRKLERLGYCG